MDSFSVQLNNVIDGYSKELARATTNAMDEVAKESVKTLKKTSPKRSGKYAKGWTVKRQKSSGGVPTITVHNKVYQLTHLLENGHRIVNAKGEFGRVNGIKHIAPVEQWANNELPRRIEEELE